MFDDSPRAIGERIAARRRARRLTQTALAAAAHVSYATVRSVERGARRPGDDVLEAIADALGVEAAHLRTGYVGTERRVHRALPALSEVIAGYDLPLGRPTRPPGQLADEIATAVGWRLSAQYGRIATALPGLLADALRYVHTAPGAENRDAARLLASAARTADAVAYKHGAHDLSARLIELMRWAADRAADPLVQASASYVRAETFFAACAHEAGLVSLERAIEAAPPPTGRTESAVLGALHMRAAVMASRAGSVDAAETHMAYARRLGEQVALEGTYFGTAFGPGSVRVHEVSVAVGLGPGYADRALSAAHAWNPATTCRPSAEAGSTSTWQGRRSGQVDLPMPSPA